jgi:LPXTG-motif cell wall-anchored protein
LAVGEHALSVYYTGYEGPITTVFTITKAKETYEDVNTGAPSLNNWITLFGLSSIMALGCWILLKKNEEQRN